MPVWVHKKNATQFMKPLCVRTNEWPNPACKHVHNGVLNTVLLYEVQTPSKGIGVIRDGLRCTDRPTQYFEALRTVVLEFANVIGFIDRTCDVILNLI
jgi:hypothetical protein